MNEADFYKQAKDQGLSREEAKNAWMEYSAPQPASVSQSPQPSTAQQAAPTAGSEIGDLTNKARNAVGMSNQDLQQSPTLQFLKGALDKARQTTVDPLMQLGSKVGLPFAKKMLDQSNQEDAADTTTASKLGAGAADIGMQLAPMGKAAKMAEEIPWLASKAPILAKALGMSLPGTAEHQAQDYGKTGEVSPGAAAGEVAANTALMGGGMKAGQKLSEIAPSLLQWVLKVPGSVQGKANGPDWNYALQNGIVPFRGGAKKMGEQLSSQETDDAGKTIGLVPRLAEDNRVALDNAGVINQIPNMGAKARMNLAQQVGGNSGITSSDEEKTLPYIEDFINSAKRAPNYDEQGGYLPGRNTNDWREGIDKNYPEDDGGVARTRAAKIVRNEAVSDIDNQMSGNPQFLLNRQTLAKATPISMAVQDYLNKPSGPKLLQMGRYGARAGGATIGAAIGSETDPNRAEGAVLGGLSGLGGEQALERLLTTPGGNRLLFEAGKNLSKKSPTRMNLSALGRYGAFSPSLQDSGQ